MDIAAGSADAEIDTEESQSKFLFHLCILPPLQKSDIEHTSVSKQSSDVKSTEKYSEAGHAVNGLVHLPPIRPEEPVASLRAALSEVRGYAHITNYRLVLDENYLNAALNTPLPNLEKDVDVNIISAQQKKISETINSSNGKKLHGDNNNSGKKKKKNKGQVTNLSSSKTTNVEGMSTIAIEDVVSAFTGQNAVIMAPHGVKNTSSDEIRNSINAKLNQYDMTLDDYGDLTSLLPPESTDLQKSQLNSEHEHVSFLQNGSAFRMILTRYDTAGIRDHVSRLRILFDGNVPFVLTLDDSDTDNHSNNVNATNSAPTGDKNPADAAIGKQIQQPKTEKEEVEDSPTISNDEEKNLDEKTKKNDDKDKNIEEKDKKLEEEKKVQQNKLRDQAKATHLKEIAEKMPSFPLLNRIAIDGNNLEDYYYLACGEEEALLYKSDKNTKSTPSSLPGTKNTNNASNTLMEEDEAISLELDKLDKQVKVNCIIRYSGFNPPPSHRRLLGDLAYFEVSTPGSNEGVVHITATAMGFYVNRTSPNPSVNDGGVGGENQNILTFNPSPAKNDCFSHELLDCLLKRSKSLRSAWARALNAAKQRANLIAVTTAKDSPLKALHRVAVRSNLNSMTHENIDTVVLRPSWLVTKQQLEQKRNSFNEKHDYNVNRAEDDLTSTHGLDIRGGSLRDWNEELQSAKEMPTETLQDRIDRARLVHKVLTDFGDAALVGALAILDGHITPMNPNEPTRSHVYLHNNIFFSRAVDAGADTFKISQGDKAARKSASRDAQCMGMLHRLDVPNLHTLATVLVDHLGTRIVCQSIVPGILHGEKTHILLYGAVEAISPLSWDEKMHSSLEKAIGKGMMVASRKVPTWPLSKERMEFIRACKVDEILSISKNVEDNSNEKDRETTLICGPVEAKGIKGSDQRNYVLDLTRLTPRDANWLSKEDGGTGNWEEVLAKSTKKAQKNIPNSITDDEWTMAVLRPELITNLTHKEMTDYLKKKKIKENLEKQATADATASNKKKEESEEELAKPELTKPDSEEIKPEDEEYLSSLRYNVNVFLPNMKSLSEIDDVAYQQHLKDESRARNAANHLWNIILPALTKEMRENSSISAHQIPVDGFTLTESLHSRGINCRYLGRLAQLAEKEEQADREAETNVASEKTLLLPRKTMPLCWLELLECEMVARAAKHVLDRYMVENGGGASLMPAVTIASFLSAVMSTKEESAGETELRMSKKNEAMSMSDEDFHAMTVPHYGGGDAIGTISRSRNDIWTDIEAEIGRRFRYSLTLYNAKPGGRDDKTSSRIMFVPLLRRICQRTGIRLVAKNYDLGGKCVCSGGSIPGLISATYPVSPVDIVDVIPLVKHSAAHAGEGFVPCSPGTTVGFPSLHILLPDAKATFEAAHTHWNAKSLPKALDLTQEAASLYQRVVDTPLHVNVSRCLDLTAVILFQAQEPELAAANAARALAVAVQLGGFDCAEAITAHTTLAHILISSGGLAGGVKHLRAALYLMELMGGSHYAELANMYHKLGTMYHEVGNGINALRFYQEASRRQVSDRMVEGMISKSSALVLAALGQFKSALESERKAYGIYKLILGEDHEMTITSANSLKHLMKLAVEQGARLVAEEKKRLENEAADAIANEIEADEVEEEEQKKKKRKKKKSKKKT